MAKNNKTQLAKSTETVNVKRLLEKDGELTFIAESNVEVVLKMDLLRKLVPVPQGAPQPTDAQMLMFAYTCATHGLNPYLEECWLSYLGKHKGWTPLVAAQSRVRKAQAQPDYDGFEWGWITSDGKRHLAGQKSEVVAKIEEIIGLWGCIYRKNRAKPFYHEIFKSEYLKQTESGYGSWDQRPLTMLLKVIRDQTHKFAYADKMGNLMTENEARFVSSNDVVSDEKPRSAELLEDDKKSDPTPVAPPLRYQTEPDAPEPADEIPESMQTSAQPTVEETEAHAEDILGDHKYKCDYAECGKTWKYDQLENRAGIPTCPECGYNVTQMPMD